MALRLYYKNTFFHIGHLGAILENERLATERKVPCYVYVDDRDENGDGGSVDDVRQYIRYLKLTRHRVVSVRSFLTLLEHSLSEAAAAGKVTLHCSATNDHVNSKHDATLVQYILSNAPRYNYTVFLAGEYAGRMDTVRGLELAYTFVRNTLDRHFGVDATVTTDDATIRSFCYTKRHWELSNAANAHLLTLRGLEMRHFPPEALLEFNREAVANGGVQIARLRTLALAHLVRVAVPLRAVLSGPAEFTVDSVVPRETRYEYLHEANQRAYVPLNRLVYADKTVLGMDRGSRGTVQAGAHVQLAGHSATVYVCTQQGIVMRNETPTVTMVLQPVTHTVNDAITIRNWVASDYCTCAVFYVYSWFYTGYNRFCKPDVCRGYVDNTAFTVLNDYVYVAGYGYFRYDQRLTQENGTLTFMQVLSDIDIDGTDTNTL